MNLLVFPKAVSNIIVGYISDFDIVYDNGDVIGYNNGDIAGITPNMKKIIIYKVLYLTKGIRIQHNCEIIGDVVCIGDMSYMFESSVFNGDISNWDVSNLTDMCGMFWNSQFTGDISKWDVSNVTNMGGMFAFSKFNGDISKWDVSNVTNMSYMFYGSKFNGDISNWSVSRMTHNSRFDENAFKMSIDNIIDMLHHYSDLFINYITTTTMMVYKFIGN
jgi:surface protein